MMKQLKYIFAAFALALFAAGCGDSETDDLGGDIPGTEETPAAPGELSLSQTGTQGIVVRDFSQDFVQHITVSYGKAAESAVDFSLTLWTEQELAAYNSENGTDYQLLPAELYELAANGTVAQGQTSVSLPLTIRVEELADQMLSAETVPNYVLPLRLASQSATVQPLRSEVVYTVLAVFPTVHVYGSSEYAVFAEAETVEQMVPTRLMNGTSYIDCTDPFQFSLRLADNAAGIVADYNAAHGTAFELPSEDAYTVSHSEYKEGVGSASVGVTFYRDRLGGGVYLLPLQPAVDEGGNARGDAGICYLKVGKNTYTNPIIRQSVPDPTVIRANDGYYYLYGTEDLGWIPVFRSRNMVDWERMPKDCFQTQDSRPVWEGDAYPERSLWAPEIRYINGKYLLYYSFAIWGNGWNSEVGVATSDSPTGPFTDYGQVIDASDMNVENSIDQFEYEENGKRYLFWGSFHGIWVTELTDDGLSVKRNPDGTPTLRQQVAGGAYEGSCIYKRGNYYYLFASIGSCCEGANSTYQTVVGRSESLFGPYVNRSGRRMLDNQHEILIYADDNFVGLGHNSVIQHDDAGQTWIIFHGYVRPEADNGRYVFLNQLYWDEEGWPYVEDAVAAPKAFAPVINP